MTIMRLWEIVYLLASHSFQGIRIHLPLGQPPVRDDDFTSRPHLDGNNTAPRHVCKLCYLDGIPSGSLTRVNILILTDGHRPTSYLRTTRGVTERIADSGLALPWTVGKPQLLGKLRI